MAGVRSGVTGRGVGARVSPVPILASCADLSSHPQKLEGAWFAQFTSAPRQQSETLPV